MNFQEKLARRTAELAGTAKMEAEARRWAERLISLGFKPYREGEVVSVYADRFYFRVAISWAVGESRFSHTVQLRSGHFCFNADVPVLEPQYQAFLECLAEELGGQIQAAHLLDVCGCQETTLAVVGEGWYLLDEWILAQRCEEHQA